MEAAAMDGCSILSVAERRRRVNYLEKTKMKSVFSMLVVSIMLGVFPGISVVEDAKADVCLGCHEFSSPGIVKLWQDSVHSSEGVECETCHLGKEADPSTHFHFGTQITAVPSPEYCRECHEKQVEENSRSKHAWSAFMGPLKPYYLKARADGLDPLSQETARQLDPEEMAKRALTPLFPDSGILEKIGLLDDPNYHHNNVNLGCIQCHGSFVIADPGGELQGWPNVGIGRVNPDGSLGSCSACHTNHDYSVEEARKPETCGQCHLGPDHPQHEIYEESKHGNMSGFGGVVDMTHEVGERLYWELQPKKSVPQWKGPEEVDLVAERVPDPDKAESGRNKMRLVCFQCHSSTWTDGYFDEFDKVVEDYNMLWERTDALLEEAYTEELISRDNPLDETPEIMHYLIWHHDGRRWRMGASMMGPDWTHWNGAVDAIMNKLGTMINDIEMRRKLKAINDRLNQLP
jgi:hypothetical protein